MTNRRQFIQQGSLLALAMVTDQSFLLKSSKELGIQLYTVRNEIDKLEDTLKQLASAGYTNIELYGYDKRYFFGKTVKQMADLLGSYNLKTTSGHYLLEDMIKSDNYNWDSWKYLLEDAAILKHKYLMVPFFEPHGKEDNFKRLAERLNKAGELSKQAGMVTGYHNHDFEFRPLGNTSGYEILLNNTEPDLVKFEMDLYWVKYAGQEPMDWFKKYPGRFPLWHVKDMAPSAAGAKKGQTCEVGNGVIDWKAIFKHKKLAGLDYAFVEQEQYTRSVFESVKISADYMKKKLL